MKYICRVYEINRLVYTGDGRTLLNEHKPQLFLPNNSTAFIHSSRTKLVNTQLLPITLLSTKQTAINLIKVTASTFCNHDDIERRHSFKKEKGFVLMLRLSSGYFLKDQENRTTGIQKYLPWKEKKILFLRRLTSVINPTQL